MAKRSGKRTTKKFKTVATERVKRSTLRMALVGELKKGTGRKDIDFREGTKIATQSVDSIPIEQRAGFPLILRKGGVHPRDWLTHGGCKIIVDVSRAPWLPDDWGQGIKQTVANGRSTGTGGGILTTFVAPDGKSFFHKHTSEEHNGKGLLTIKDGWNGQVRQSRLQAKQAIDLARKEGDNGGLATDEQLFKVLTPSERKCVPKKDEFHVGIVSARRATTKDGVRDIFTVQLQFEEAGIVPTWYVDEQSYKDYKALGLNVVIGGKLTASRNKVLADAKKKGKICVQASDDITCWEYRDGPMAKERTDNAVNAACAAAKRLIVSPVAAARFIIAKMRGAADPKPKLGGVYMLGSCSRTFGGPAFSRNHFILGDFFVVEPDSTLKFDLDMKLKEDYDFSAAHITKYGSVMRCNRMTLSVKHYSNSGGAVTTRDKKGQEEQRNIAILQSKWPNCFRKHPRRKNEVVLQWKKKAGIKNDQDDDDDDDVVEEGPLPAKRLAVKKGKTKLVKSKVFVKKARAKSSNK